MTKVTKNIRRAFGQQLVRMTFLKIAAENIRTSVLKFSKIADQQREMMSAIFRQFSKKLFNNL
jgi:hypothetical protein